MIDAPPTFSESWHRVANLRVSLHPSVRVRRQSFRGERWFVLENPFANQFFRLHPAAWEFVGRLRPDRTVDEVWRENLDRFPDQAPGQEAALRLLGQLYQANLLQYEQASDASALFDRYEKRTQRELRARLSNIMFFRIPLLDPDRLLVRLLPLLGWLFSPIGGLLWLVAVGFALKTLADNGRSVSDQFQGVLAPGNLPLLYLAMVVLKALHEFGHAFLCRKYGGEVHTLGLMFMIFTPVPYVDVTSSWSFRSRWQRVLVGLGGMMVELFIAAIAVFVWSRTGPGTVHSIAYNLIFVAGVSTLIFNGNPLLRFDGYYILGDLLGIPNLGQRANQHLRHLAEQRILGVKKSESPARSAREASWLTVYGIASGIYRVIVFGGMLLAIADRYLLLGLIMLATCAIAWVLVPTGQFINYLATSPRLERCRPRAIAASLALALALVVPLGLIPFPNHFRAPGVVQAVERSFVLNDAPGQVARILAEPGAVVRAGQPLVLLTNRQLELELVSARAALTEAELRIRAAMSDQIANLKPLNARRDVLADRLARLELDHAALTVVARQPGTWVAPDVKDFGGRWLPRGSPLGLVVQPSAFEFTGTVQQSDADRLFRLKNPHAEVRLPGQAALSLPTGAVRIVPAENSDLPSAALGWAGGGEVATSRNDPHGRRASEPFFEIRAPLPASGTVALLHGRSGKIRFDLPPQPLLQQWWRKLMQLLQRRYQL